MKRCVPLWQRFVQWCKERELPFLPSTGTVVALYLLAIAQTENPQSSFKCNSAAISAFHEFSSFGKVTDHPLVCAVRNYARRVLPSGENRTQVTLYLVPPTPRHWPRPPVLAAHQTCRPHSSPLRISRPGGSVVRPATCGPADRWRSTVAARTEAHSTLPGVLGATACVALPRAPFVVASSFCSTASPQSHAP